MAFSYRLECLGKADKGREERDHSGQELHELGEIGWASPPIKWRALPGTRAADSKDDSIRAADSRPILPSHCACAKKRAAKQRPSSESACYLRQSNSLNNK